MMEHSEFDPMTVCMYGRSWPSVNIFSEAVMVGLGEEEKRFIILYKGSMDHLEPLMIMRQIFLISL